MACVGTLVGCIGYEWKIQRLFWWEKDTQWREDRTLLGLYLLFLINLYNDISIDSHMMRNQLSDSNGEQIYAQNGTIIMFSIKFCKIEIISTRGGIYFLTDYTDYIYISVELCLFILFLLWSHLHDYFIPRLGLIVMEINMNIWITYHNWSNSAHIKAWSDNNAINWVDNSTHIYVYNRAYVVTIT